MTVTADHVAHAENVFSRLEEALYYMQSAVEELQSAGNSVCSDLAADLANLIASAEEEKEHCDEVLAEADRIEQQQMNRDYERSVL